MLGCIKVVILKVEDLSAVCSSTWAGGGHVACVNLDFHAGGTNLHREISAHLHIMPTPSSYYMYDYIVSDTFQNDICWRSPMLFFSIETV